MTPTSTIIVISHRAGRRPVYALATVVDQANQVIVVDNGSGGQAAGWAADAR